MSAVEETSTQRPEDVADMLGRQLAALRHEELLAVLLNNKNRKLAIDPIAVGGLNGLAIKSREVFRRGIELAAARVILVHNHPSGDPEPSPEDVEITGRLSQAGDLVGIHVVDHVILGGGLFVSIRERGLVPP